MAKRGWAIRAALIATSLMVAGCSQKMEIARPAGGSTGDSAGTATGFTTFPDMPMPVGGDIDVERTLIFGTGESWFGRLVINTPHSTGDMFTFYREGLPGFGWQEVTSVRAAVSVLTYVRSERVATIQVQARAIRGSEISITVSPRGAPATATSGTLQPRMPVETIR
jgi:hypothetical protein